MQKAIAYFSGKGYLAMVKTENRECWEVIHVFSFRDDAYNWLNSDELIQWEI